MERGAEDWSVFLHKHMRLRFLSLSICSYTFPLSVCACSDRIVYSIDQGYDRASFFLRTPEAQDVNRIHAERMHKLNELYTNSAIVLTKDT